MCVCVCVCVCVCECVCVCAREEHLHLMSARVPVGVIVAITTEAGALTTSWPVNDTVVGDGKVTTGATVAVDDALISSVMKAAGSE